MMSLLTSTADALTGVPEGWSNVKLGELLDGIDAGRSFLCDERPPAEGEVGVVKISAVTWGKYDEEESKTCTNSEFVEDRFLISAGDFLISRANTIELVGACVIATNVSKLVMLSDKVLRLRFCDGVENKWILHFLRSQAGRAQIEALATGNQQSMRNVGQDRLRAIVVPIAPLAEQRRIVEKVEALLALVESAHDRLTRFLSMTPVLRRHVVELAASGELTREWRKRAGRKATSRSLTVGEVVVPGGLFDGPFGSHLKTSDYITEDVRVIRLENIAYLRFINQKSAFISEAKYNTLMKHRVKAGDVIVASFITDDIRTCVLPKLNTKAINKADCFCVRVNREIAIPPYVALQLSRHRTRDAFVDSIHGVTRPRINLAQLRQLAIELSPLDEQSEIVRRVDAVMTLIDAVEMRVKAALGRAELLKQAILVKAFSGELVPTEAELARGEIRNHELSSVLSNSSHCTRPVAAGRARRALG